MRYYEVLYIVHPALEGGHLQDIVKSIDGLIDKHGGKIEAQDNWGKKKLAYPIDKQNYGIYILTQFSSDGTSNNNILQDMEHNPDILGSIISKIEQSQILSKDEVKPISEEEAPVEEEAPAEEEAPDEEEKNEEDEK